MTDLERTYLQTPEQWTRFLSALVHELRTPLASLRMLTELLTGPGQAHLGDTEKRYLGNMEEVIRSLQGVVGDVGELARLLGGRSQARPADVLLGELVEQAEEAVRPRAWEAGIALTDSLDPALPRSFRTDAERLRRALTLLLGAAVDHAESEVFLRLDVGERDLRVVLSSDGPPFPEASLAALFEPFDGSIPAVRGRGNRGLALPLASELTRTLGGTLRADNRGGRPTFHLSLPAAGG